MSAETLLQLLESKRRECNEVELQLQLMTTYLAGLAGEGRRRDRGMPRLIEETRRNLGRLEAVLDQLERDAAEASVAS